MLRLQCTGERIPKCINVDLSKLEIGDSYRIGDIEMSQDISIIEDLNSIIASVTMNKKPSDMPDGNFRIILLKYVRRII